MNAMRQFTNEAWKTWFFSLKTDGRSRAIHAAATAPMYTRPTRPIPAWSTHRPPFWQTYLKAKNVQGIQARQLPFLHASEAADEYMRRMPEHAPSNAGAGIHLQYQIAVVERGPEHLKDNLRHRQYGGQRRGFGCRHLLTDRVAHCGLAVLLA
jgi:hypothetical protein